MQNGFYRILTILYYHNFKCQIHLEAVKCDVAAMRIRYRVTGALFDKVVLRISAEHFVRCDKRCSRQVRTGKAHASGT